MSSLFPPGAPVVIYVYIYSPEKIYCAGIPGVTKEAVNYVHERLLLDLSDEEAAAR